MRRDGVEPTPLAMTRWAIERGYMACSLTDIDEARMRLLPLHQGVFTESGVRLLRPDKGGQRVFIRCLRYVSKHPIIAKYMQAARASKNIDADFYVDPNSLGRIWFKNLETAEFIEIYDVTNNHALMKEGTWSDVMALEIRQDQDEFSRRVEVDQRLSALHEGQDRLNEYAQSEYQHELDQCDTPPPKSSMTSGIASNREREMNLLLNGMPILKPTILSSDTDPENAPLSGTDESMRQDDDQELTIFDMAMESDSK